MFQRLFKTPVGGCRYRTRPRSFNDKEATSVASLDPFSCWRGWNSLRGRVERLLGRYLGSLEVRDKTRALTTSSSLFSLDETAKDKKRVLTVVVAMSRPQQQQSSMRKVCRKCPFVVVREQLHSQSLYFLSQFSSIGDFKSQTLLNTKRKGASLCKPCKITIFLGNF